jgi:hypothetical protein
MIKIWTENESDLKMKNIDQKIRVADALSSGSSFAVSVLYISFRPILFMVQPTVYGVTILGALALLLPIATAFICPEVRLGSRTRIHIHGHVTVDLR